MYNVWCDDRRLILFPYYLIYKGVIYNVWSDVRDADKIYVQK